MKHALDNVVPLRPPSARRDELSDEALLAAAGTGDAAAIALLFRRHHRTLYRAFTRLLGAREDLDDLVQATFLEAWRSAPSFSGRSSAKTWLIGIAYNVFRHHVRAQSRRRSAFRLFALESKGSVSAISESQVDARRDLASVEAAVLDLPEDLRSVFVLCQLEDMSSKEAAEVLGTREGTVRRRLHDARRQLAQSLSKGAER